MEIERHLTQSGRILVEDLDWNEARNIGLTSDETVVLTYFADIESQTILYMRAILNTKGVLDPDVISFLTIWNYEEFYHGQALAKLLDVCGHPLARARTTEVREKAMVTEALKAIGAALFSKILPSEFIALYMSWGALNELTTLRGYESIEASTSNPVLRELCARIAKQERRHFAWYYNSAEERLRGSSRAQKLVRFLLKHVWSPVGAGVKTDEEVIRVYNLLFPQVRGLEIGDEIDSKMRDLPGLEGVELMTSFARKASENQPAFPLDANPGLL